MFLSELPHVCICFVSDCEVSPTHKTCMLKLDELGVRLGYAFSRLCLRISIRCLGAHNQYHQKKFAKEDMRDVPGPALALEVVGMEAVSTIFASVTHAKSTSRVIYVPVSQSLDCRPKPSP